MCNCKSDLPRLKREVDEAYKLRGEKWVIIENKSHRYETIPDKSLENLNNIKIIYTWQTIADHYSQPV